MNEMSILLSAEPWFIDDFTGLLFILLVFGFPVIWTVFDYIRKVNETNKRTQIILTAIEKSADSVPEELINSLNKPKISTKERLLGKLMRGIICIIVGIGTIVMTIIHYCTSGETFDDNGIALGCGLAVLAVGVAFLIYYFIGRRWLRSEIEEENKKKNV